MEDLKTGLIKEIEESKLNRVSSYFCILKDDATENQNVEVQLISFISPMALGIAVLGIMRDDADFAKAIEVAVKCFQNDKH